MCNSNYVHCVRCVSIYLKLNQYPAAPSDVPVQCGLSYYGVHHSYFRQHCKL